MPKKLDVITEKHTIRLESGDADTLRQFYPQIGYNAAIRTIVSRHCKVLRERASRQGVITNVGTEIAYATIAASLTDDSSITDVVGAPEPYYDSRRTDKPA